jgi:hypothetical protein
MTDARLDRWLSALGYDPASPSLHYADPALPARHPYAPELRDLLHPKGEIRAEAVFDVEGVPTVGFFVDDDGSLLTSTDRMDALRERIWNQGLVSVLLVVTADRAVPVPVAPRQSPGAALTLSKARADGPLSQADIQSGDIRERYDTWFNLEDRVDRRLVANLRATVSGLADLKVGARSHFRREDAQYLVGQVLFVSYLEHRGIVGRRYRKDRKVGSLKSLVDQHDRAGLERLLDQLKTDFNGDFLDRSAGLTSLWHELPDTGFNIVADLLGATDIEKRQPSFFPYNFRYIPVELLSGIYESFLGREAKKDLAAYYTPRHLANLVVDQALAASADILAEKIYDGACGSGILLTTAFRRLLGEAEARGGQLSLVQRIALLKAHIFGSDISEAACRVTAFSLYLSLLERLEPSDVAALCDDAQVKLPPLRGANLMAGPVQGNYFSPDNPLTRRTDYTLLLSNPPWMETDDAKDEALEAWAHRSEAPRVLKQIAADFAWQASMIMAPGARLCFILPMSLLLKPTSQPFLRAWLERVAWHRVINFGDLKELLFDDGRLACAVVLAERRVEPDVDAGDVSAIGCDETFDYWAPKADLSLAFGRLALHGVDRHEVQTRAIARNNQELVTRMWGDGFDLALWTRLRLRGTFGHLLNGRMRRWTKQKGFHRHDSSVPRRAWVSTAPLAAMPFLKPAMLYDALVLDPDDAGVPFPVEEMLTVPRLADAQMMAFQGPRILFPDGSSPDRSIRATFVAGRASFMSSIGVIAGPVADEDLLRFAAVYLRSDLVRYFLVTQLYQLLGDRDRVSLSDIAGFPFYPPERHPDPDAARIIVREVADLTRELERTNPLMSATVTAQLRPVMETLVQRYFGLAKAERALVSETVKSILPMIRPYGLRRVFELARARVSDAAAQRYARALRDELLAWRDARGGEGAFHVKVMLTGLERAGPFGVVRVEVTSAGKSFIEEERTDRAVNATLTRLRQAGLLPLQVGERIYFSPDAVIQAGNAVYLIKPQAPRLWLCRQARRDAQQIVLATTRNPPPHGDAS